MFLLPKDVLEDHIGQVIERLVAACATVVLLVIDERHGVTVIQRDNDCTVAYP